MQPATGGGDAFGVAEADKGQERLAADGDVAVVEAGAEGGADGAAPVSRQ